VRVHILGICGTFMGGLALMARSMGYQVSGSDTDIYPPMSSLLQEQGVHIQPGYAALQLNPRPDLVVVGNALSRGNPAVEEMLRQRIPYTSGPHWLMNELIPEKKVLAIAGTHGKTTTSAMVAFILDTLGLDPGFLIGGVPGNFPVSARCGKGQWFVIEADEYDTAFFDKRSKFVHYHPEIAVLGNLEFDHADIFDSIQDIERQFHHLVRTVPPDGTVLINADEPRLQRLLEQGCWSQVQCYSTRGNTAATWQAQTLAEDCSAFEVTRDGHHCGTVQWHLFGRPNMSNALAAIAAAVTAGVSSAKACATLAGFRSPRRRLELISTARGISLFDDFAHHPTAVRTTLAALRSRSQTGRVIAVLELRSNTMRGGHQRHELADALTLADIAIVRWHPDLEWDPQDLAPSSDRTTLQVYDHIAEIVDAILTQVRPADQVVLMSNGNFGDLRNKLIDQLSQLH